MKNIHKWDDLWWLTIHHLQQNVNVMWDKCDTALASCTWLGCSDRISSCGNDREDWSRGNKGCVKADGLLIPVLVQKRRAGCACQGIKNWSLWKSSNSWDWDLPLNEGEDSCERTVSWIEKLFIKHICTYICLNKNHLNPNTLGCAEISKTFKNYVQVVVAASCCTKLSLHLVQCTFGWLLCSNFLDVNAVCCWRVCHILVSVKSKTVLNGFSGWWFQRIWKILIKLDDSPR